ncbi:PAS domain-containing protein [Algoriphagus sp.]|uniref:PAS domain-containing protein n=1 Tax=Algoriphagus sp. TaxID=1872435 RepID=UPI00391BA261
MNLQNAARSLVLTDQSTSKDILLEQFEKLTQSGTWEYNLTTGQLVWSDGVFRMLGYRPQEFEVTFDLALSTIHPDDRDLVRSEMEKTVSSLQKYKVKKRLITNEGKVIWIISIATVIQDPLTGEKKLIGVFQNIGDFIQTKEKLKKVRRKNRTLIENLDGVFWEADAQTFEFSYISPQVEQITGYTEKEWMASKTFWQDHIHPEDRQYSIEFCHSETQKLKDHSFDYRFLTKNKKTIWFNDRVKVISKNGKPKKLQGMMVEITSQKAIEKALNEEISLNQSILHQLPSVFFLFDSDGKFLLWNNQFEKISEFGFEEIAGMKPSDFFGKNDKELVNAQIQKVIEVGNQDVFLTINSKSGKDIPFFFSVSRLIYKDKLCIFGTGQDITELVESRKSTLEHIERYQMVTKATNDAIWDFDMKKNNLYWGEGFLELFGYDPKKTETSFDFLLSLIHPDDRKRIYRLIQKYFQPNCSNSNWLEEYRFLKSDGNYTKVQDKALFIRDEAGNITRVVGAMQDISKQKEYEESLKNLNEKLEKNVKELAVSNHELQQFAYVVSHDLQEPLRMITSFMGLLERRYQHQLDTKALEYISFATNGAKQMQNIILDLLELSRVGKMTETKEILPVNQMIDQIKQYLRKIIHEKNATINYEGLPTIKSYRTILLQIFQNLIGNSLKYSKSDTPPEISIKSRELTNHWEFTVVDNGIGIDPEYFNKIFIIFQRLHLQRDVNGTGIGLAIVKKAVEYLEGEIHVKSNVGEGSEFTFTIKK